MTTMIMLTHLNVVHTLPTYCVDSTFIWLYNLKFVKSMKLHVNIRNIHLTVLCVTFTCTSFIYMPFKEAFSFTLVLILGYIPANIENRLVTFVLYD
jgi:hypothetical protein